MKTKLSYDSSSEISFPKRQEPEDSVVWQRGNIVPLPTKSSTQKIGSISKQIKGSLADVVFQEFFRKRFQVPTTHHDPRVYSYAELCNHLDSGKPIATKDGDIITICDRKGQKAYTETFSSGGVSIDNDFNHDAMDIAHTQLSRTNYPTYFIDDQTMRMLLNSKVSHNIPMDEVSFPLPSMLISLPKGLCTVPNGSELATISITKTYEWETNGIFQEEGNIDPTGELHKSTESWSELKKTAYDKINRSSLNGNIIPALNVVAIHSDMEQSVIRFPICNKSFGDLIAFYSKNVVASEELYEDMKKTNRDIDLERATTQYIAELAIKILLFMESRKDEYSSKGKKIKEARYRRGKLMNEAIWGVNYIGKNYGDVLTKKGYGVPRVGRTQRYHWRQGHIRGQWYGKGRSKYKTVIIDPYSVNLDEAE